VIKDVEKISEALKIYYDVNGYYPTASNSIPKGIEAYLDFYPAGETCSYNYERKTSGTDYELTFCLGNSERHILTSQGIK
jgi:hypothetical protein